MTKTTTAVRSRRSVLLSILITVTAVHGVSAERRFRMGTSIFSDFFQFAFENLDDKDLLALHIDDFLGIPWAAFRDGSPLPSNWVARWTHLRNGASSSGKVIYLALGPLKDRKTLAAEVDGSGNKIENWAPVDGSGCYPFSTDSNAQAYKQAYINYARWAVDTLQPTYLSLVVEMNIQFKNCPMQKAAFIQWHADVHQALKQSYPNLVIFPTFQAETMYGLSDSQSWCGGIKTDTTLAACFQQRLDEAVSISGDRIAFSTYPSVWKYPATLPDTYTSTVPYEDMFTRVKQTTAKKIWISETGWPAAQILGSYQHTTPASACGPVFVPTPTVAGEAGMGNHMSELLAQAQAKEFEAVVWWENRDLLDATAANTCPCSGSATSCNILETLYTSGGTSLELLFRLFGNMGLRYNDGSPRTSVYNVWTFYLQQSLFVAASLDAVQAYPNPLRPSRGHTGMNFINLPPGATLRIYTLVGEKVSEFTSDVTGHATWDGRNQAGRSVASGVYIVYIEGGGQDRKLKVAVQR